MADDLLQQSLDNDMHFRHSCWHFIKRDIEHGMIISCLKSIKTSKPNLPFTGMFYYYSIFNFICFPLFSSATKYDYQALPLSEQKLSRIISNLFSGNYKNIYVIAIPTQMFLIFVYLFPIR